MKSNWILYFFGALWCIIETQWCIDLFHTVVCQFDEALLTRKDTKPILKINELRSVTKYTNMTPILSHAAYIGSIRWWLSKLLVLRTKYMSCWDESRRLSLYSVAKLIKIINKWFTYTQSSRCNTRIHINRIFRLQQQSMNHFWAPTQSFCDCCSLFRRWLVTSWCRGMCTDKVVW